MSGAADYDVIIVGAGTAGCSVAINLDRDLKVLMVDRSALPRDKSCAGMLKQEAFGLLRKYGMPNEVLSFPRALTPRGIDISTGRELTADIRYYNSDRRALDAWLLGLAGAEPNVQVWGKAHFVDLIRDDGAIGVKIKRESGEVMLKCRVLVGADGAGSAVRRAMGFARGDFYATLTGAFELERHLDLEEFVGFFGNEIPYYHWVVPKGRAVQVGVAFDGLRGGIRNRFEEFKDLAFRRLDIRAARMTQLKGHMITKLTSMADIRGGVGRALLVGEAAGLIDPSILEGITYAVRSGELCADAINGNPDDPLPAYQAYLKPILRRIFWQLQLHKVYRSKKLRLIAQALIPQVRVDRKV